MYVMLTLNFYSAYFNLLKLIKVQFFKKIVTHKTK